MNAEVERLLREYGPRRKGDSEPTEPNGIVVAYYLSEVRGRPVVGVALGEYNEPAAATDEKTAARLITEHLGAGRLRTKAVTKFGRAEALSGLPVAP